MKTQELNELVELTNGFAFKSKSYSDSGFFVMRISNVQDGYIDLNNPKYIDTKELGIADKFILAQDDILISLTGYIGRVGRIEKKHLPAVLNQRVAKIQVKSKEVLESYLFHFLKSSIFRKELESKGKGAAQQNVSIKDIKGIRINLPSIQIQREIVSKLDQAFEAIDQAIANTEKNIENVGVLKKEMNKTLLSSQSSKKNQIFPLSEIAEIINGYSFSSKDFDNDHPTKSIKITNVGVHSFVETSDSRLPASFFRTYQKFSAKEGDLVIALTRTIISSGLKVALVPKEYDGALLNQRVAIIRVNEAVLDKDLLFEYLSSDECISYVLRNVKSTMQPNLSIGSLKKMPIKVPSQNEQTKMKSQIKEVNKLSAELTDNLTTKLNSLKELKMSILEKAFKGELV